MSVAVPLSISSVDQAVSFQQLCDMETLVIPNTDAQIKTLLSEGAVIMPPDCVGTTKRHKDARRERACCLLWARAVIDTPDSYLQLTGPLVSYIQGLYTIRSDHLSSTKWATSLAALISANMAPKGDTPQKSSATGPVRKRANRSAGSSPAGNLMGAFTSVAASSGGSASPADGGSSHSFPPSSPNIIQQQPNPFSSLQLPNTSLGTAPQQPLSSPPMAPGRLALHSEDELLRVLPDNIKGVMYLASDWSTEKRAKHDKFVKGRKDSGAAEVEDADNPMWAHRLRLVFASSQPAEEVKWERHSKILAKIINFDNPDLYRIQSMDDMGDATAREALRRRHEQVERAWRDILGDVQNRVALTFTTVSPLFVALLDSLVAKKDRLTLMLHGGGSPANEILRSTEEQIQNVKEFFKFVIPKLEAGARSVPPASRAQYINNRFTKVMQPVVESMLCVRAPYNETLDPFAAAAASSLAALGMVPISPAPLYSVPPPPYTPQHLTPLASQSAGTALPPPLAWQTALPSGTQPLSPPPPPSGGPAKLGKSGGGAGQSRGVGAVSAGGLAGHGIGGGIGKLAFLGKPVSATLVGRSLAVMDVSQQPSRLHCNCRSGLGAQIQGPHLTFECPLKYLHRYGSCPGFNHDGSKDPNAWAGDDLTDATKKKWRDLIAIHALQTAISAQGADVNFS